MKNLLLILLLTFTMASCNKKTTTSSPSTLQGNDQYTGTYVLTSPKTSGSYDTIAITLNVGDSHYISRLCSTGGKDMKCTITGSSLTLPKNNNYPMTNFYTEGYGVFSGTQLTMDYTNDRSDYNITFHKVYHSIYVKL